MTERPEEVPSEDVVRGPEDNEGVPEDDDSGDEVRPRSSRRARSRKPRPPRVATREAPGRS